MNDEYENLPPSTCARLRVRAEAEVAELGWYFIPPPSDECAIPFIRVLGSLREWVTGRISDRTFARVLRKAAFEIQYGR